jgi:hypothetical protein
MSSLIEAAFLTLIWGGVGVAIAHVLLRGEKDE